MVTLLTVCNFVSVGRCRMALGMQSGEIADSALSASTSLPNHDPTNARYAPNSASVLSLQTAAEQARGHKSMLTSFRLKF